MQRAVFLILFVLAGCAHANASTSAPAARGDVAISSEAQFQRTVLVERLCASGFPFTTPPRLSIDKSGVGSGVIVEPGIVLTAWHVLDCPPMTYRMVGVTGPDGVRRWGDVLSFNAETDIARVTVRGLTAPRLEIAAPRIGDHVCIAPAHPKRDRACGEITHVQDIKVENGTVNIADTVRTVPGNSGSGMYNARGELVGLATNGYKDQTGGCATSLLGRVP